MTTNQLKDGVSPTGNFMYQIKVTHQCSTTY
jgi:hypothetical protein